MIETVCNSSDTTHGSLGPGDAFLSAAAATSVHKGLSISVENTGINTLSDGTLQGIWKKAETLIQTG